MSQKQPQPQIRVVTPAPLPTLIHIGQTSKKQVVMMISTPFGQNQVFFDGDAAIKIGKELAAAGQMAKLNIIVPPGHIEENGGKG